MIIGKYDVAAGSGTKTNTGSTAVAGSGSNVDLAPITEKVAALETKVSQLELQLSKVLSVLAGLDGRFLSRLGDRSEYSYAFGALYTDFIQSELYGNGVGFRVSGSPTATVEDKYNLIIKDVGWGTVPFNTVQASASYVDHNTDEATDQLVMSYTSIGAANAVGYLLLDCGAELTNERCFTEIAKSVSYSVRLTVGGQTYVNPWRDAETDGNGRFILYFENADNVSISVNFKYTYSFRQYGNITSGTYRMYIRGTDPDNSRTDCYAAAMKSTTVNAGGVTVMTDNNGARLTSSGVQKTTDGGNTWT